MSANDPKRTSQRLCARVLKRSRDQSLITEEYLDKNGINYTAVGGEPPTATNFWYDGQEVFVFSLLQWLSIIPTLVVWKLGQ